MSMPSDDTHYAVIFFFWTALAALRITSAQHAAGEHRYVTERNSTVVAPCASQRSGCSSGGRCDLRWPQCTNSASTATRRRRLLREEVGHRDGLVAQTTFCSASGRSPAKHRCRQALTRSPIGDLDVRENVRDGELLLLALRVRSRRCEGRDVYQCGDPLVCPACVIKVPP